MTDRRRFIRNAALGLPALTLLNPLFASVSDAEKVKKLTILYTNDTHSRIDPFPADHPKFPGMGGFATRASIIRKIKEEEESVLLLDAGDIFQGTPFFNFYGGEPEFRLMSAMQYDCATLGNHDFDNGVEGLFGQMKNARFEFVNSNYNLSDTPLFNRVKAYRIFIKGGLKIGVYGLGVDLEGLVNRHLRKGVVYTDPITAALKAEKELKHDFHCDLIICLSHLGYRYKQEKISDLQLAPMLSETHLIIGGHTHTFLDSPVKLVNKSGQNIFVTQVGWAGVILGRIDFLFDRNRKVLNAYSSMEKIYSKTTLY
jgi:5'-nucleotidase